MLNYKKYKEACKIKEEFETAKDIIRGERLKAKLFHTTIGQGTAFFLKELINKLSYEIHDNDMSARKHSEMIVEDSDFCVELHKDLASRVRHKRLELRKRLIKAIG